MFLTQYHLRGGRERDTEKKKREIDGEIKRASETIVKKKEQKTTKDQTKEHKLHFNFTCVSPLTQAP